MLKIVFMTLLLSPDGVSVPVDQEIIGGVTKENIQTCNAKRRQKEFTYFPPDGSMAIHICMTTEIRDA